MSPANGAWAAFLAGGAALLSLWARCSGPGRVGFNCTSLGGEVKWGGVWGRKLSLATVPTNPFDVELERMGRPEKAMWSQ